jgi:methionyl-tRNA formyltransferase
VLIQKKTPISGTDTPARSGFDRLFPMGVDAMLEAVDLVKAGRHRARRTSEATQLLRRRQRWYRSKQAVAGDRSRDPRLQSGAGRWSTLDGKTLKF